MSLERGMRALLIIGAAAILAWGWGIDLVHLAGDDTRFARVVHGVLSAVIIALIADVLWHATKTAIDRKLAEVEDLGQPNTDEARRRARLHTLLPIFRNVLFVLYQVPLNETHVEDSQREGNMIHRGKRVGFAMAAAIGVRGDYDTARLRELAKRSEDANQTRRLLALAAIYDGGSRTEAAKIGGVGLQTVRDWVLAFNAEGPPGLVNGKAPGNAPLLTQAHRQALLEIVESGPIPAVHGVVRWRLIDLAQWVFEEFRISISKQTLSRELRALELRKLSARPRHHAQDAEAMAAFKKTLPPASTRSPSATRRASR
jgi:transposase